MSAAVIGQRLRQQKDTANRASGPLPHPAYKGRPRTPSFYGGTGRPYSPAGIGTGGTGGVPGSVNPSLGGGASSLTSVSVAGVQVPVPPGGYSSHPGSDQYQQSSHLYQQQQRPIQGRKRKQPEPVKEAGPKLKCTWHCICIAFKALSGGILLLIIGSIMSAAGFAAEANLLAESPKFPNGTLINKDQIETLATYRNLTYAGPVIMGLGGIVVIAALVLTFEVRDTLGVKIQPVKKEANHDQNVPIDVQPIQTISHPSLMNMSPINTIINPNPASEARSGSLASSGLVPTSNFLTVPKQSNNNHLKFAPSAAQTAVTAAKSAKITTFTIPTMTCDDEQASHAKSSSSSLAPRHGESITAPDSVNLNVSPSPNSATSASSSSVHYSRAKEIKNKTELLHLLSDASSIDFDRNDLNCLKELYDDLHDYSLTSSPRRESSSVAARKSALTLPLSNCTSDHDIDEEKRMVSKYQRFASSSSSASAAAYYFRKNSLLQDSMKSSYYCDVDYSPDNDMILLTNHHFDHLHHRIMSDEEDEGDSDSSETLRHELDLLKSNLRNLPSYDYTSPCKSPIGPSKSSVFNKDSIQETIIETAIGSEAGDDSILSGPAAGGTSIGSLEEKMMKGLIVESPRLNDSGASMRVMHGNTSALGGQSVSTAALNIDLSDQNPGQQQVSNVLPNDGLFKLIYEDERREDHPCPRDKSKRNRMIPMTNRQDNLSQLKMPKQESKDSFDQLFDDNSSSTGTSFSYLLSPTNIDSIYFGIPSPQETEISDPDGCSLVLPSRWKSSARCSCSGSPFGSDASISLEGGLDAAAAAYPYTTVSFYSPDSDVSTNNHGSKSNSSNYSHHKTLFEHQRLQHKLLMQQQLLLQQQQQQLQLQRRLLLEQQGQQSRLRRAITMASMESDGLSTSTESGSLGGGNGDRDDLSSLCHITSESTTTTSSADSSKGFMHQESCIEAKSGTNRGNLPSSSVPKSQQPYYHHSSSSASTVSSTNTTIFNYSKSAPSKSSQMVLSSDSSDSIRAPLIESEIIGGRSSPPSSRKQFSSRKSSSVERDSGSSSRTRSSRGSKSVSLDRSNTLEDKRFPLLSLSSSMTSSGSSVPGTSSTGSGTASSSTLPSPLSQTSSLSSSSSVITVAAAVHRIQPPSSSGSRSPSEHSSPSSVGTSAKIPPSTSKSYPKPRQ